MRRCHLTVEQLVALAKTQTQGMFMYPEVAKRLPFNSVALESEIQRYRQAWARCEIAKLELKRLMHDLAERRIGLHDMLTRNLAGAKASLGSYAQELKNFGGKPLKGPGPGQVSGPTGGAP